LEDCFKNQNLSLIIKVNHLVNLKGSVFEERMNFIIMIAQSCYFTMFSSLRIFYLVIIYLNFYLMDQYQVVFQQIYSV